MLKRRAGFSSTALIAFGVASHAAECPPALKCPVGAPQNCVDPRAVNRTPLEDGTTLISADQSERSGNGDGVFRGNVEVRQGDRVVRAEEIEYEAATEDIRVPGAVQLADPNLILNGDTAQVEADGTAQAENTTFVIPARAGHGSAELIRVTPNGEIDLRDARYTTCPGPDPAWELILRKLHVDQEARIGTGGGIRVEFKGVPIFYTPYISFPVGNEPKTGFLLPEPGYSSRSGIEFSLPWYWHIDDQYDATFTPSLYSERGIDMGGEFRFLSHQHEGQLNVRYLPNDRQTGTDRSFVQLSEQTEFNPRLRFSASGINVSDRAWLEDFSATAYSGVVALPRTAELAYRSDEWLVRARTQHFQIIDPQIDRANRPYTLLPQVLVHGDFLDRWAGLDFTLDSEFVRFRRGLVAGNLDSQRVDMRPEVRWPLGNAGIFVQPAAALRYTAYRLDPAIAPTTAGESRTITRTAPILSLEGGAIFERDILRSAGSRTRGLQTLEPRFLYAYIPYRRQDDIPVFDTTPADFNLSQLFRTERYAGPDRLGDTHHIALGATSRLFAADGRQLLSATIGELYRFAPERVGLPGETLERRGSSDVIGEFGLTAYKNWSAHAGAQWDPTDQRFERVEFGLQYRANGDQVMNLSYRQRRDALAPSPLAAQAEELKQVDASAAWPIGSAWSLYGRVIYSLKDHAAIERLAGLQYRACCWGVRLLAHRAISTIAGDPGWEFKAQLELTGLSKVGDSVDAFLAASIQGYSAARNDFSSIPITP